MKSGPDCPRVILGSLAVLGLIPGSLTGLTVDTRYGTLTIFGLIPISLTVLVLIPVSLTVLTLIPGTILGQVPC